MPKPWENLRHRITAIGSYPVCAIYRFEIPLRAMIARSWCGATVYGAPGTFDYDAAGAEFTYSPGSPLLTQRHIALDAATIKALHADGCRFIHDIDDLLWQIPDDNPGGAELTADVLKNMDASLRLADLVTTSTQPLASALERIGIAAVVFPNLLDPVDWRVQPKRNQRSRLRIGWYGQRSVHTEDLNIIQSVVEALSREVDFVFYGDVPRGLVEQQDGLETYPATAMELFPAMLAMLDLDILLSPLAKNPFNECKSNLRIIQAGMLGYAAIATDIEPHRTLPVALVDNTPAAWIGAIRDRIGEQAAVREEGRTLHRAVRQRFILDDERLEQMFTTWTRRAPPETET